MSRQQTLTKFLTNPPRPSGLRSKQTRAVPDSDSSLNAPMDETDSDLSVTHLTQNTASSCVAVSSPPSGTGRTRPASPEPTGSSPTVILSSDEDSPEPAKWKRKRKLNRTITDFDSDGDLPHKRRRLLQRGLKPDRDEEDDKPDPACKEALCSA